MQRQRREPNYETLQDRLYGVLTDMNAGTVGAHNMAYGCPPPHAE